MCGRFTLTADMNELQSAFPWVGFPSQMTPRYNIAPSQPVAVIANDHPGQMNYFSWGLIPSWVKELDKFNPLINARCETLADKPSFRNAYQRRRCLILADGFFEWRKETDKTRTPIYIHLKENAPFAFAGIWERWQSKDGSEILSCAIVTTTPNELISTIHNRMPVILSKEIYPMWLDTDRQNQIDLSQYLIPYPSQLMLAFPVSKAVNSPKFDKPENILPV